MLAGRKPTEAEARYLDDVAGLGCIVCRIHLHTYSPAEIHHVEGKTKPGAHFKILPLCANHHRIPGETWVSRADGRKAFEQAYGPEEDLIVVVGRAVELARGMQVGRRS